MTKLPGAGSAVPRTIEKVNANLGPQQGSQVSLLVHGERRGGSSSNAPPASMTSAPSSFG